MHLSTKKNYQYKILFGSKFIFSIAINSFIITKNESFNIENEAIILVNQIEYMNNADKFNYVIEIKSGNISFGKKFCENCLIF